MYFQFAEILFYFLNKLEKAVQLKKSWSKNCVCILFNQKQVSS